MEDKSLNGNRTKLAQLRAERGLSVEKLAKMLDPPTSGTQIIRLERGERKLTEKWVLRIAKALEVFPYDLYEESDMIVSAWEREVVDELRQLSPAQRQVIAETIHASAKVDSQQAAQPKPTECGGEPRH